MLVYILDFCLYITEEETICRKVFQEGDETSLALKMQTVKCRWPLTEIHEVL